MKKSTKVLAMYSIALFVVALAVLILEVTLTFRFLLHPALNFFLILFAGFGIFNLVSGFIKKYPAYFFLSGILLGLSALYILLVLVTWWIAIIAFVVLVAIISCLSLIVAGNKTEEIALNKDPEYKNYEQRAEEKKVQDEIDRKTEEENLPKIKSFDD